MKPVFHQTGAAMIELLIAMLIIAFGALGFVGLQVKTSATQLESYQRSQALILINDITERMSLNRRNAANYVAANVGVNAPADCTPAGLAALASGQQQATKDLCEWAALLQGAAETQGAARSGAMLGARGCISAYADAADPAGSNYLVTVAWQGIQPSGAPASACGVDQYSAENLRRTVNKIVRFASLG
ncbi:MAG: type IV pilus modification protein PilV [Rhodoferax sp.]|nr:type IV pilus modification protein PilV [Rhodoferax sp.]